MLNKLHVMAKKCYIFTNILILKSFVLVSILKIPIKITNPIQSKTFFSRGDLIVKLFTSTKQDMVFPFLAGCGFRVFPAFLLHLEFIPLSVQNNIPNCRIPACLTSENRKDGYNKNIGAQENAAIADSNEKHNIMEKLR